MFSNLETVCSHIENLLMTICFLSNLNVGIIGGYNIGGYDNYNIISIYIYICIYIYIYI